MPAEAATAGQGTDDLAIREALPTEFVAIGDLTVRAYALVGDPLLGDPTYTAYEAELRDVASRAASCTVLVAADPAGPVLGSVTYVPGPGTPWSETELDGEAGFRALAVAPGSQGRGIGRALVVDCIGRARQDGRIGVAILTRPAMIAAHRLYESLGFLRVPARDWEFEPGQWLWSYVLTF